MPEELLKAGAAELAAQLRVLEADAPPADLDTWAAAFEGEDGEEVSGELQG